MLASGRASGCKTLSKRISIANNVTLKTARASPGSDAQGSRLPPFKNGQRLSSQGRARLKKQVHGAVRVDALNVESTKGR